MRCLWTKIKYKWAQVDSPVRVAVVSPHSRVISSRHPFIVECRFVLPVWNSILALIWNSAMYIKVYTNQLGVWFIQGLLRLIFHVIFYIRNNFEHQSKFPGISHIWFNIYLCFLFHPTLRAGKTLREQATVAGVYFHALPRI